MTARIYIRKPTEKDCQELVFLHQRSRALHFPWAFPPLALKECRAYIDRCQGEDFEGLLICHAAKQRIVGVANLSQVFYRAFQNAYLGCYVVM